MPLPFILWLNIARILSKFKKIARNIEEFFFFWHISEKGIQNMHMNMVLKIKLKRHRSQKTPFHVSLPWNEVNIFKF